MSALVPCAACHRHARGEGPCPFCEAAPRRPPAEKARSWAGPLTRAALVYGATVLASCGSGEQEPPVRPVAPHEAPIPVDVTDVEAGGQAALGRNVPGADTPSGEVPSEAVAEAELDSRPEPTYPEPTNRAEQAHAEGLKDRTRTRARRRQQRQQRRIVDPFGACCPPYGAPAADFVV